MVSRALRNVGPEDEDLREITYALGQIKLTLHRIARRKERLREEIDY
jgi:hypothetical protein